MPRTRLQFPDGAVLSVGTVSCEDQIHQAVYLSFTPPGSPTPAMELELPPQAVEVIIQQLQAHANQARFINGERMLEYPKPHPVLTPGSSRRTRKVQRSKLKKGQVVVSQKGSPATEPGNSGAIEEPPSVS